MRAENTFSVDFLIRLDKKQKTLAYLFAKVTVDGDEKEISLKQKIRACDWNSQDEALKGNSSFAQQVNKYINDVRSYITAKYRMLQHKEEVITAQKVKDAYISKQTHKRSDRTLSELVKYHTQIFSETLADGTMKNYVTTETYVKNFTQTVSSKKNVVR